MAEKPVLLRRTKPSPLKSMPYRPISGYTPPPPPPLSLSASPAPSLSASALPLPYSTPSVEECNKQGGPVGGFLQAFEDESSYAAADSFHLVSAAHTTVSGLPPPIPLKN
ncbi:hypothetical protein SAY86_001799 [Trapa natans]|uniref:Uncharacterized protein n=1 Tax=Trapa natans TaxID=22666 RepID=A0AAN7LPJ9_TRANT|nr:hypothetical protein SAY86_001799 [Trapa natans]